MTFLSKLGSILLRVTEVLTGIGPLLSGSIPGSSNVVSTITSDLQQISNVIVEVEAIGQTLSLAGSQKLQASVPLISQIILQSSIVANHKIANPDLFKQGCVQIGDGMAMILNSLDASSVNSAPKTT